MELRHLKYFVAVAEEQNVTRAAARLHVSQPPLSRQIRDLENELGVALFEHRPRAVLLTQAGKVFLSEARGVLERADEAVQTVKAVAEGKRGEIHVGYAPSLTVEILPFALRHFQKTAPGIKVRLHDLSTEGMLRELRERKLDLALTIQTPPEALQGLVFEPVRAYAVCLAAHPAHPLARVRKISLAQVAEERLIVYTLADYPEYHAWLIELLAPLGRSPHIAEEHDSATSLIVSVEAGRGVALVQQGFECLAGPRLKVRRLTPPPSPLILGAAYRKDEASPARDAFIRAVKSVTSGTA